MTAQMAEGLVFRGERHPLFANPLDGYPGELPPFTSPHTANWRGYVGTWAFRDDVLHLTDIRAWLPERRVAGMAELFPDHPGGLPADWCSDLLRVPVGEQVEYVHMGYGSTYERDLMLAVRGGRLVYLEEVNNRTGTVVRRELTAKAAEAFGADDAGFLRAVADAGWADAPKLVYADWLDDRVDPRGELIRVEVERAGLAKGTPRRAALARRRCGLYRRADWLWVKAMGFGLPRRQWGEIRPREWGDLTALAGDAWDRERNDPPKR